MNRDQVIQEENKVCLFIIISSNCFIYIYNFMVSLIKMMNLGNWNQNLEQ